jgi:hydrogenase maturation protease
VSEESGNEGMGRLSDRRIVVGLGNPVLGDDGVGWRVADAVETAIRDRIAEGRSIGPLEVEHLAVGGLRLMEFLTGFDVAILVDAAELPDRPAGEVRTWLLEELNSRGTGHLDSAHDVSLAGALEIGRRLGARLPSSIRVVTVQIVHSDEFGETLSPAVEAAVPVATSEIVRLLGTFLSDDWPIQERPAVG